MIQKRNLNLIIIIGILILIYPIYGLTVYISGLEDRTSSLLFVGDFETGDRSQWNTICVKAGEKENSRFQIVTSPVRSGRYAAKFIVHPGDLCWGSGERVELLTSKFGGVESDEYYYAWSTRLSSDWTPVDGWAVITQWHTPYPIRPALAIYLNPKDAVYAGICTGEIEGSKCQNIVDDKILNEMSKDEWHDFIVHVNWTISNQGLIEVWHREEGEENYTNIYTKNNISTLQWKSDDKSTNIRITSMQLGLYRSPSETTQILYQDDYRIGTTFESVLYT